MMKPSRLLVSFGNHEAHGTRPLQPESCCEMIELIAEFLHHFEHAPKAVRNWPAAGADVEDPCRPGPRALGDFADRHNSASADDVTCEIFIRGGGSVQASPLLTRLTRACCVAGSRRQHRLAGRVAGEDRGK